METQHGSRPARALVGCVALLVACSTAGPAQEPRPDLDPRSLVSPTQEVPGRGGTTPDPRRTPPELTTVPSDVRDGARLFSESAIRSARERRPVAIRELL